MPLTNAQNQKNHRDRIIAEFGIEEFKRQRRDYMRELRARKKAEKEAEEREKARTTRVDTTSEIVSMPQMITTTTPVISQSATNTTEYIIPEDMSASNISEDNREILKRVKSKQQKTQKQRTSKQDRLDEMKPFVDEIWDITERKAYPNATYSSSRNAIETAFEKMRNVWNEMNPKKEFPGYTKEDLEWLRNTKKISKFINKRWPDETNRVQKYSGINTIIRVFDDWQKEREIFALAQKKGDKVIQDNINKNTVRPTQLEKWQSQSTFLPKLENAWKIKKTPIQDIALTQIHTIEPPRRADHASTQVIRKDDFTDKQLGDLPKTNNYLIVNKSGTPEKFVFNAYKTAPKMGTQMLKIQSAKLKATLKKLIKDKESGDYLFTNDKGNRFTPGTYGKKLKTLIEKYTGKPMDVHTLRRAYISAFRKGNPNLQKRNDIAYRMAHTRDTQDKYEVIENQDLYGE